MGVAVVVDGERLVAFVVNDDQLSEAVWIRCDRKRRMRVVRYPLLSGRRRQLRVLSGTHLYGTSVWALKEIDDDLVVFVEDLDDESISHFVERRSGCSDLKLLVGLVDRVDWDPVSLALGRAIELGGE
jgi:hypothetical protein